MKISIYSIFLMFTFNQAFCTVSKNNKTLLVDIGYIEWSALQFYDDYYGDYQDVWKIWGKSLKLAEGWFFLLEDNTMGYSWKFTMISPRGNGTQGFTKITGRQYNKKRCVKTDVLESMPLIPHAMKLEHKSPNTWSLHKIDTIGNEIKVNMTTNIDENGMHVPTSALEIKRRKYWDRWSKRYGEEYTETLFKFTNFNVFPLLDKKKEFMNMVNEYCKEYE